MFFVNAFAPFVTVDECLRFDTGGPFFGVVAVLFRDGNIMVAVKLLSGADGGFVGHNNPISQKIAIGGP